MLFKFFELSSQLFSLQILLAINFSFLFDTILTQLSDLNYTALQIPGMGLADL
jgi:hypothetical protein